MSKNKKPICRLTGSDGNVFAIIGKVSSTLRRYHGTPDLAKEFSTKAFSAHSYGEVLMLCSEYVKVT